MRRLDKKIVFRHKGVVSTPLQSRKSQKQRNLMDHVSKISWKGWLDKNLDEAKIKKYMYAYWNIFAHFILDFFHKLQYTSS